MRQGGAKLTPRGAPPHARAPQFARGFSCSAFLWLTLPDEHIRHPHLRRARRRSRHRGPARFRPGPAPVHQGRRLVPRAATHVHRLAGLVRLAHPRLRRDPQARAAASTELYKALDAEGFWRRLGCRHRARRRRRIAELTSRQRQRPRRAQRPDPAARPRRQRVCPRARRPRNLQQPGQRLNHLGEWESEASIERRGEEAAESIRNKLLGARRIYLCSIASDAGKRAAFEILTELPIDWTYARKMEPQPDEPYRTTNQREPDWVLTAIAGGALGRLAMGQTSWPRRGRCTDEVARSAGRSRWSGRQLAPSPLEGGADFKAPAPCSPLSP